MDLGVFEARNRFSELIDAAQAGRETVVLKRGKPVAKIVPVEVPEALAEQRRQVIERARTRAAVIAKRNGRIFTHEEIIAARDDGKR